MKFYLFNLILFVFVPFLYFIQIANSIGYALSLVTTLSALLIVLISKFKIVLYRTLLYIYIFYVMYSLILLLFLDDPNYSKYFLSILAIFFILICADYFANSLLVLKINKIIYFFKILFLLLIFMALSNHFIYEDFIFSYDKSIFPNREYSHFYLHYCFFFLFFAKYYKLPISMLTLFILLIIFPSLTGLLILFLISFYYLKPNFKYLFTLIFLLSLIMFSILFNYEYYSSRIINFMYNKSALTYLQGWQYVIDSILTHPLGIGFQQMSCDNSFLFNDYSFLISQLSNSTDGHQCLDGGFNLAKLTVELGVLGLIGSLIIIKKSVHGFYNTIQNNEINPTLIFNLMLSPILIDILFRNAGLLSINLFLFMTGIIGLYKVKQSK